MPLELALLVLELCGEVNRAGEIDFDDEQVRGASAGVAEHAGDQQVPTDLPIDDQIVFVLDPAGALTVGNGDLVQQLRLQSLSTTGRAWRQQMREPQGMDIAR